MAQIKCFDKRVGITYVYESKSYYDAEKHQSRSKRKLIGKIDPETGEIVPTGKKGRPSKTTQGDEDFGTDYKDLYQKCLSEVTRKEKQISELETELSNARKDLSACRKTIMKIAALCELDNRQQN